MKKTCIVLCFGAILLSSCGGIESDAQRMADLACRAKNEAKDISGLSFDEYKKLEERLKEMDKELVEMLEEFDEKYKGREDEFKKAVEKAFEDCK